MLKTGTLVWSLALSAIALDPRVVARAETVRVEEVKLTETTTPVMLAPNIKGLVIVAERMPNYGSDIAMFTTVLGDLGEGRQLGIIPIISDGSATGDPKEYLLKSWNHAGACWHVSVKMFQKFEGEKLVGTYLTETVLKQSKHQTWRDDLNGARLTHRIYRLKILGEDADGEELDVGANGEPYLSFVKVAQRRASKVTCNPGELLGDLEELIRKN